MGDETCMDQNKIKMNCVKMKRNCSIEGLRNKKVVYVVSKNVLGGHFEYTSTRVSCNSAINNNDCFRRIDHPFRQIINCRDEKYKV